MVDDKVTHGRRCSFATFRLLVTFHSDVGPCRRPSLTDFASLVRPSDYVAQTLGRTIDATAGDDRSQSPEVGFLESQPVEKFGFVMCSVSMFHLVIQLYFYWLTNGDNCLSK